MSAGLPPVATLIPQPRLWKDVRSLKAIPGMMELEKFSLQRTLRFLKGKYLDEKKDWSQQDNAALEKLVQEACAEFPFLSQRYEGAWPIEAILRARLASSASRARASRQSRGAGSRRRSSKRVPKSLSKADLLADEDADMKDELESELSSEPDEPMEATAGPSQPQQADVGPQPQPSADASHGVPSPARITHKTPVSVRSSTPGSTYRSMPSSPLRTNSEAVVESPVKESHTAMSNLAANPLIPSTSSQSLPAQSSGSRSVEIPGPPPPQAPRAVHRPIDPVAAPVVETAKAAVEAEPLPAPVPAAIPEAASDEGVVKSFLESLVRPLGHLLPAFLDAGVIDEATLRSLVALPLDQQLEFLRTDLRINLLQSRIILAGLQSF